MNYDQLVHYVSKLSLENSLSNFLPELVLCGTIILMLVLRVLDTTSKLLPSWLVALAGSILAFVCVQPWAHLGHVDAIQHTVFGEIFTGMLVYDAFTIYFRALLVFITVLFIILTRISGLADQENSPDFYTLVLGAVLGMCLMASANHLLIVFLAVEMASVPSYALAGILKGNRKSSEAAVKYSIYGAGAAGVMLYGISLIAGITGSAHLPTIAWRLSQGAAADYQLALVLGGLMIMVGLAFKLSAVPFHFWCPDVFEGASAEVNAFLSVASKAAALALLVRLAVGFAAPPDSEPVHKLRASLQETVAQETVARETRLDVQQIDLEFAQEQAANDRQLRFAREDAEVTQAELDVMRRAKKGVFGKFEIRKAGRQPSRSKLGIEQVVLKQEKPGQKEAASQAKLQSAVSYRASTCEYISYLVAILAAITCTFGNLAAYGQTNIKRLLAYSTIAHAGYMMMPVAAGLMLMNTNPEAAPTAFGSLLVYAAIYAFMNLGAFAIVAFLRNAMGSEEIADYAGLVRTSPGIVICFCAILFSLIGLPPLAGFMAKLVIFAGLIDAKMYWLLVIGGINTAVSLFYYLKVVKAMTFEPEPDSRGPVSIPLVSIPGIYVAVITAPLFLLIIQWNGLHEWAVNACQTVVGP